MRARVLAVALLALLAGCNGFAGDDAGAPTSTLTPAPVPTVEPPSTVGTDHAVPERVPARHRSALADTGYTIVETVRVGPAANATFQSRTRVELATDQRSLHFDDEVTTAPAGYEWRESDIWWNGERTFYRYTWHDGRQRYFHVDGPPTRDLPINGRLHGLFASFSATSVDERGNATVLAGPVEAIAVPRLEAFSAIENATMTARIDGRGVITRMAIGYDAVFRNQTRRHVRWTYNVTAVGSTSPSAPSWREQFHFAGDEEDGADRTDGEG